jgi:hypothetical protein
MVIADWIAATGTLPRLCGANLPTATASTIAAMYTMVAITMATSG